MENILLDFLKTKLDITHIETREINCITRFLSNLRGFTGKCYIDTFYDIPNFGLTYVTKDNHVFEGYPTVELQGASYIMNVDTSHIFYLPGIFNYIGSITVEKFDDTQECCLMSNDDKICNIGLFNNVLLNMKTLKFKSVFISNVKSVTYIGYMSSGTPLSMIYTDRSRISTRKYDYILHGEFVLSPDNTVDYITKVSFEKLDNDKPVHLINSNNEIIMSTFDTKFFKHARFYVREFYRITNIVSIKFQIMPYKKESCDLSTVCQLPVFKKYSIYDE